MLVAQALVRLLLFFLDQFPGGVIGTDQQVADDRAARVSQCRDRDHRWQTRAVLADIGQLVNVLDPARGFEHQGFKAWLDRGRQFRAQGPGADHQLLGVGNVGRRNRVYHLAGVVAQHPLGPDVEDLDHTLRIRRDAGEVGAVEDRTLQRTGLKQSFLGFLTRGVVGADQQIANDGICRVAQSRHRDHRWKTRAVLADIGQLIDVFDPARGFEHQGFKPGCNVGAQFIAQGLGARDQLLGIRDIRRRSGVHHLAGGVAQHPLGPDVEDLDHPPRIRRDAGKVRAVEDRCLQSSGRDDGLFDWSIELDL